MHARATLTPAVWRIPAPPRSGPKRRTGVPPSAEYPRDVTIQTECMQDRAGGGPQGRGRQHTKSRNNFVPELDGVVKHIQV